VNLKLTTFVTDEILWAAGNIFRGIALLASYLINKSDAETLEEYLNAHVFTHSKGITMSPDPADVAGFETFMERYKKGLPIERAAVDFHK